MNTPLTNTQMRDVNALLHPYTDATALRQTGPLVIDRGRGVRVWDDQGREYIEGMAGLWCCGLGFSDEELIEAAREQLGRLPYYHLFAGRSYEPAVELAEKIKELAPGNMARVIYQSSGSEANDTQIKLQWFYNNARGKPEKKKIISRIKGYHGVTIATASLTGLPNNHRDFDLPIDRIVHTSCPHYWKEGHDGETEEQFATRCAEELDALIQGEGPDTIAAFIAEPVMGAGGVVVPPATYWDKIQAVLRKYDILLVADEVINGFGRTGNMFGCETYDIQPDAIVLSKQITSSYVPFSAILLNDRFYGPVAEESGRIGVLGHGYTGGGHPVGAAVALENIRIIEEEGLVKKAAETGAYFRDRLAGLASHPMVGEVRGVGLIAAVELVHPDLGDGVKPGQLGKAMNALLFERGVISRAMIDAMAFCPPLIIERDEIDLIVDALIDALAALEEMDFT